MFGHVKGAFTDARSHRVGRLEVAHRGTLFMDEIANLSMSQQQSLLRVLETGELERVGSSSTRKVDVRLLSATNADLDREVEEGRFRKDLLFRINTIEIRVPPLRERPEDIPALAVRFLARHGPRHRKAMAGGFEPAAMEAMMGHGWPGNVRELDHAVERGVLMSKGDAITAADLALQPARGAEVAPGEPTMEEMERLLIRKALARHDGNVSQAAETLGLSRSALYRRLQRYGL
jgi:DNA-binding NtrC family response regulator